MALEGNHAFLSPSKYHWVNDDEEKLITRYSNWTAVQRGVELHEFASIAIKKKIKVARYKAALYQFINDAIGFNMESEQVLWYSENCYGTTDAISFKDNLLRIFDLKTGVSKASFKQLDVYAALFCLEYEIEPEKIEMELRIYQGAGFEIRKPPAEDILYVMNTIIAHDKVIQKLESDI